MTGDVELTGFDENIATALFTFAKLVRQTAEVSFQGFLSTQEAEVRRRYLLQIADDAEALSKYPSSATYQAFERLLNKAQELGAGISGESSPWPVRSFTALMCGLSCQKAQASTRRSD